MVMSPLGVSSSLALVFLGARGETAHELDGLLRLDSMTSFNPHVGYFKYLRYMNQGGGDTNTAVCNALLTHEVGEMTGGSLIDTVQPSDPSYILSTYWAAFLWWFAHLRFGLERGPIIPPGPAMVLMDQRDLN